jgi:glycerate-2-kinase
VEPRALLLRAIEPDLQRDPPLFQSKVYVIAAGKAAEAMLRAFEERVTPSAACWPAARIRCPMKRA